MKYVGLYQNSQDIATKKNVDEVARRIQAIDMNLGAAMADIDTLWDVLGSKQGTITGGASTIVDSNLTASRALVSDGSGKVAVSDVTSTELGYLDGVTSAIQTQLDDKVPAARTINKKALSGDITLTASDVGALPSTTTYVSSVDGASGAVTTNAVKTTAQTLTNAQKSQARTNIGAGTSSFSGSYNDLTNKPSIPTVPDNIVTYAAGATVEAVTGVDADTLQGHAASYFATQDGLTAANSSITANTSNITELSTKVSSVEGSIDTIQTNVNTKLDKSGGTLTGALVAQNNANYTTKQVRNIIISTADPSGGSNGDIWIRYTE